MIYIVFFLCKCLLVSARMAYVNTRPFKQQFMYLVRENLQGQGTCYVAMNGYLTCLGPLYKPKKQIINISL